MRRGLKPGWEQDWDRRRPVAKLNLVTVGHRVVVWVETAMRVLYKQLAHEIVAAAVGGAGMHCNSAGWSNLVD